MASRKPELPDERMNRYPKRADTSEGSLDSTDSILAEVKTTLARRLLKATANSQFCQLQDIP